MASRITQQFGWLDLSTDARPSYALVCEKATGQKGTNLVKYKGRWMTEKRATLLGNIDKKKFPIIGLPFDARACVLSHLCPTMNVRVYLRGVRGQPPSEMPLPAVVHAGDRKLRLEAIIVTIKQSTLEIHSGPGNAKLQEYLASLDFSSTGETNLITGFEAVRSLTFPYFSRFPHHHPAITANNDIELMKKSSNLRKVCLNFVWPELFEHGTSQKSVAQLRAEYRLDGMLELGKLKKLILMAPNTRVVHELAAWFEGEYAARDRMLEVERDFH
ncbi:hypothetical protein LTR37_004935 [Vermiconidia calcicola]|uniref:Uncharacterized protein n=1 Tax=Vermiconidia calcicola TaxID=1690605 RepID=A0ACC3NL17_9PEZI|nr:hypothetical protein LTR37_004935 [Vermiconidia calcicola]